jgi:hypothetical protein
VLKSSAPVRAPIEIHKLNFDWPRHVSHILPHSQQGMGQRCSMTVAQVCRAGGRCRAAAAVPHSGRSPAVAQLKAPARARDRDIAGEAAVAVYRGPYDRMNEAYHAIDEWMAANKRESGRLTWEIHGDPTPDPADTEMTVVHLLKERSERHWRPPGARCAAPF